jgi:hypothetical protein
MPKRMLGTGSGVSVGVGAAVAAGLVAACSGVAAAAVGGTLAGVCVEAGDVAVALGRGGVMSDVTAGLGNDVAVGGVVGVVDADAHAASSAVHAASMVSMRPVAR